MTITTAFPDLLNEVRAFRSAHPAVRYVDLISLDIPGHFYGKRYPIDMLEKVAAGSALGEAEVERAGPQIIERGGDARRSRGRERGREARLGAAGRVDHVAAEEDHAARLQAARQDWVGGGHRGSPVVGRCRAHSGTNAAVTAIGARRG